MNTEVIQRPRRGLFRTLWWLLDGGRRLLLNLLFLALLVALAVAWVKRGPAALQDKTVLVLRLAGPLVEQRAGSPRDQALQQLRGDSSNQVPLRDLLAALEAAAADPQISSVLLVLDDMGAAGAPMLREAAAAISRFKQASGKKVLAWGSGFDQRQYLLASAADELLLHPMGAVQIEGYGRLRSYYRDAFDRLGVAANVIRMGKYKNFGEPYFANGPSPETVEADAALYEALWADYTARVEAARKLPAGSVAQAIADLPQSLPAAGGDAAKLALQLKWVDGLKTRDELRELLIQRGARDDESKSFRQVSLADYLARQKPRSDGPAVGVVVAQGEISDGEAGPGAIGGLSTAELVRQARNDDQIKAVVLRVNSPGGSAFGAELVRRELQLTRAAGKPVVVSMGDVAASGGYWISLAADEVIADAATITGSIGVFGMLPTADGLLAKLPVHTQGHGTTWLTNAYDPRTGLDPRLAALTQAVIGRVYADFTTLAAQARKSTPERIDAVAQGRVWTGSQAQAHGLVDRIGSYSDALAAAASRAKLDKGWRVAYVERDPGRLNRVLQMLGVQQGAAAWLQEALAPLVQDALAPLLRQAAGPGAAAGEALGNALLPGAAQELAGLADLMQRRQGFATLVHCLCTPP